MRRNVFIATALVLFLGLSSRIFGAEEMIMIKTVAVMPFTTSAESDRSIDLTRLVEDCLVKNKFKVISQNVLESFLAKKRIRRTDLLDRSSIRELGAVLKTDVLITGSAATLAGSDPLVAINAQMIECIDGSIVWADSVSCTGKDFVTFLGLGRITSLKKLTEIAIDDLFKGLPARTEFRHTSSALPFEIVRASFFPKVLRGGKRADLSIEVKNIKGQLRDIRAFVLDTKIELKTKDGRWHTGTFTAPTIEGVYPLKLYVTDRWNKLITINAAASLVVRNTAPHVTIFCPNKLISPNNDGINDYIRFFPKILKATTLESWRVEIKDEDGNIARSEHGFRGLPQGFVWQGRDNYNQIVKDGTYFCRLIITDKAGNISVTPEEIFIVDAAAPDVRIFLAGGDEEEITLNVQTKDISKIADWELIVFDDQDNEVEKFGGKGKIPATISLALKKKLETTPPEGKRLLTYFLYVSDIAGNRLEVIKQPLEPIPSEKSKDKEPEKKEKIWVDDF